MPAFDSGRAVAVLNRSAEEADGWVSGGRGGPEDFAIAWQKVLGYAREAGKDPDSLDAGKLMYICVGDDRDWCRNNLVEYTHAYYGDQYDVDNNCAFGPP
ncbi:MAG: LLM class flavin-dependent oxidoreductase, partial [Gemmatimonadetes bacterium]|nr:LLM class flavin-dependent oxidoreductase [Gemmatimonadota bacterium]